MHMAVAVSPKTHFEVPGSHNLNFSLDLVCFVTNEKRIL